MWKGGECFGKCSVNGQIFGKNGNISLQMATIIGKMAIITSQVPSQFYTTLPLKNIKTCPYQYQHKLLNLLFEMGEIRSITKHIFFIARRKLRYATNLYSTYIYEGTIESRQYNVILLSQKPLLRRLEVLKRNSAAKESR